MTDGGRVGPAGRLAHMWINSKLTPLLIGASLVIGGFAVWKLPREEEPQIVVPMVDVFVEMPGASARETCIPHRVPVVPSLSCVSWSARTRRKLSFS